MSNRVPHADESCYIIYMKFYERFVVYEYFVWCLGLMPPLKV